MLKSMTAYGRAAKTLSLGHFVVEIQSVNRKFLDIACLLPKELSSIEGEIKKAVGAVVSRGQVTIKIFVSYGEKIPLSIEPNLPLAKQLKKAWEEIFFSLDMKQATVTPELLASASSTSGLFLYKSQLIEEKEYLGAILEVLQSALQEFLQMQRKEGKALQQDLEKRLERLQEGIVQIEALIPRATERYRQKLMQRLEELLPGRVENEERILREIAVFAEKTDIAEEVIRFQSHLQQMKDFFLSSKENVGKHLEFLIQELNREINTISSKSSEIAISRLTIEIKGELERIREQIQNVE